MNNPVITVSHSDAAPLLEALGIVCPTGGSIEVNRSVTLRGVISKGEDTEANATCKALSLALVACLVRHLGAVREIAIDAALKAIIDGEKGITPADTIWAEALKGRIATALPKTPVSGRRTGKLIVERAPVSEAPSIELGTPEQLAVLQYVRSNPGARV
jgi:hypothetical protein